MRLLILTCLLAAVALHADAGQPVPPPRVKAAAKQKPDAELILGTWTVVGLESGGKAESDKNYRGNSITFARGKGQDTATLRERGFDPVEFAYKLDPAATPRVIDLALPGRGVTFRGIYKLDGDDLTVCISNGGARPTDFSARAADTELFTLKRGHWERYSDRDFGFSVEMPGKPEERRREIATPAGKLAATLLVVPSEMERVTYVVAVARLPGKPDAREAEEWLAAAKAAALAEVFPGGRPAQEERRPGPRVAGANTQDVAMAVDLPGTKDRAAARVRLFVAGDRLYALLVAGSEEGTKSPNVAQFWNSFRQPAEKKGKN